MTVTSMLMLSGLLLFLSLCDHHQTHVFMLILHRALQRSNITEQTALVMIRFQIFPLYLETTVLYASVMTAFVQMQWEWR